MKRTLTSLVVGLGLVLVPAAASAQSGEGFQKGTLIIGAERMTGLYFYSFKAQVAAPGNAPAGTTIDVTNSGTAFNLLWGNSGFDGGSNLPGINPSAIPRLGVDYMLTELISLGGSVGYYSASGSQKASNTNTSTDTVAISGFAFAPRVGFAFRLTDSFLFWPRVGITYAHESLDFRGNNGTLGASVWDLTIEPMFVFAPVPHFGFSFGPLLDLGLGGGYTIKDGQGRSTTFDFSGTSYGAIAGIIGYL